MGLIRVIGQHFSRRFVEAAERWKTGSLEPFARYATYDNRRLRMLASTLCVAARLSILTTLAIILFSFGKKLFQRFALLDG